MSVEGAGEDGASVDERRLAIALGYRPVGIHVLPGGNENHVIRVEQDDGEDVVLRYARRPDDRDTDPFEIESWCASAAAAAGVATPAVLQQTEVGGRSVLVQRFVPGRPAVVEDLQAWRAIGSIAARLSAVDTRDAPDTLFSRFGRDLDAAWLAHIEYNLDELTVDDPLRSINVYSAADTALLQVALERLRDRRLQQGLVHGDLSTRNLIQDGGEYVVVDWGAAHSGPSPWGDLRRIHDWWVPGDADLRLTRDAWLAVLHGANITPAAADPIMRELTLLHSLDVIRWALAQRPDRLAELLPSAIETVRRTVAELRTNR